MIIDILAEVVKVFSFVSFGGLIITIVVFGIPVVLIILFVKYLIRSNEERRRLRLEVGKLADELEQVRKQKGAEKGDSSADSV